MRRRPLVLLNGRLLPAARATIAALDRGFLYGDGLFETVRAYRGEPFALNRHLARLARSARVFRIPFDAEPGRWLPGIRRLLRANRLVDRDAAVRLTVSRGPGPLGIMPPARVRPTILWTATPLDARLAAAQQHGAGACFFPFRLVTGTLPSHKTLHYLPAVLGKIVAARRGAWEALYLDADHMVLEGTTSNVFAVLRGTVVTPPLRGILPGVTRQLLAREARRARIALRERPIARRELLAADEVFLTASTIEVLPVVRIERRRIGDGRPGPITRTLQEGYRHLVAAARRDTGSSKAPRERG